MYMQIRSQAPFSRRHVSMRPTCWKPGPGRAPCGNFKKGRSKALNGGSTYPHGFLRLGLVGLIGLMKAVLRTDLKESERQGHVESAHLAGAIPTFFLGAPVQIEQTPAAHSFCGPRRRCIPF